LVVQYLERRPDSLYRQLFIKGRKIRAEILWSLTVPSAEDGEVYTPEQVAENYGLPLEAVREAIEYCESHPPEIALDHAREERIAEATGQNHPDYKWNPKAHYRLLSSEEWARLLDDEPLPG
jgi:uncharacterized protein (DUF433 family)